MGSGLWVNARAISAMGRASGLTRSCRIAYELQCVIGEPVVGLDPAVMRDVEFIGVFLQFKRFNEPLAMVFGRVGPVLLPPSLGDTQMQQKLCRELRTLRRNTQRYQAGRDSS